MYIRKEGKKLFSKQKNKIYLDLKRIQETAGAGMNNSINRTKAMISQAGKLLPGKEIKDKHECA